MNPAVRHGERLPRFMAEPKLSPSTSHTGDERIPRRGCGGGLGSVVQLIKPVGLPLKSDMVGHVLQHHLLVTEAQDAKSSVFTDEDTARWTFQQSVETFHLTLEGRRVARFLRAGRPDDHTLHEMDVSEIERLSHKAPTRPSEA